MAPERKMRKKSCFANLTYFHIILESPFDFLPAEIVEKILMYVITTCTNAWPNHVIVMYNNIRQVCRFFNIVISNRARSFLPRVHISRPDLLTKPVNGKIRLNMQRVIRTFGSFSGLVIDLRSIINHPNWNSAWLLLAAESCSWFVMDNIYWRSRK